GRGHLPGILRPLQHARGGRRPCAGLDQGAGILRMTDETKVQPTATAADTPAEAPLVPGTDAAKPPISSKPAALPESELTRLTDDVIGALKTVYDPEIPADIYEIGLVYKID